MTPDLADTAALVARVEAALDGGAAAIQYRNKTADARAAARAGRGAGPRRRGRAACCSSSTTTRALRRAVGADGVHLGEDDGSVAAARALLGPERIVGVSCYDDFARAEAAVAAGADYVAFGSFFASGVKPQARRADARAARARRGRSACRWSRSAASRGQCRHALSRPAPTRSRSSRAVFDAPDLRRRARTRPARSSAPSRRAAAGRPRNQPGPSNDRQPQRSALRPCPAHDSRRRQLAGARLPLGRRHAALLRARRGRVPVGRRRQALHRLRRLVGPGHPRPRAPGGRCAPCRRPRARGLSFGAPTEAEIEMAELLCRLLPSLEMVRLVSSGTEATMTALRLARGFTGRSKIVKFEGCYHGHGDSLLVKAGSGALTFGQPSSAGVPAGHRQRDDRAAVQRPRRGRGGVRRRRRRHRLHHRRAGRRQHEPDRAARRASSRGCARSATATARC